MNVSAKQIAFLREKRGLTQKELADAIGYSRTYIADIENGRVKPSRRFIEAISSKYGLSTDNFLINFGDKLLNTISIIPSISGHGFVLVYEFTEVGLKRAEDQITAFLEGTYKYLLIDFNKIKSINHFFRVITNKNGQIDKLKEEFKVFIRKEYCFFIFRNLSQSKVKHKAQIVSYVSRTVGISGALIVVDKPSFLERNVPYLYYHAHLIPAYSGWGKIHR
jgi:transcriptional regulator with XRE-family HTH domain